MGNIQLGAIHVKFKVDRISLWLSDTEILSELVINQCLFMVQLCINIRYVKMFGFVTTYNRLCKHFFILARSLLVSYFPHTCGHDEGQLTENVLSCCLL